LGYTFDLPSLGRSGSVAQSVEQRIENPCVGGSIPSRATIFLMICPPGQIIPGVKRLPIEPPKQASFCEANGIRKLSLFGSQLHDTARPDSDIDLLVEFYPDRIPSFFEIARMQRELSEMLAGQ
jgi:predicted nucleotidyltransferase